MFESRDDICVPPVVTEQTTERVLTMRFEPVSDNHRILLLQTTDPSQRQHARATADGRWFLFST